MKNAKRVCHYGVCLDAEDDPDGDGLSNQQERLLGTFCSIATVMMMDPDGELTM